MHIHRHMNTHYRHTCMYLQEDLMIDFIFLSLKLSAFQIVQNAYVYKTLVF